MEEQSQGKHMRAVEMVLGGRVELAQRVSLWVGGKVKRKNTCGWGWVARGELSDLAMRSVERVLGGGAELRQS